KFGFKAPKISVPEADLELPDVKVKGPKVEGDFELSIDDKKSEFKRPKFGFKGPKISGPDIDLKGSSEKMTNMEIDLNTQKVDASIEGNADFGLKNRFKRGKSKEKASIDIDVETGLDSNEVIDLNLDSSKKGFEISLPSFGIGSKSGTPQRETEKFDINLPDVEVKTSKKLKDTHDGKSFEFHFPKFGFKGKSGTLPARGKINPEIDVPDIKIKKSGSDVDISLPDVHSKNKSKTKRHFTLPRFKFGMKGPSGKIGSLDKPEIDVDMPEVNMEMPKVEGDINLSLKKKRGKSKEKDSETSEPKEEKDWQLKMPRFRFNKPKISGQDIDIKAPGADILVPDVEIPRIEGEIDLSINHNKEKEKKQKQGKDWDFHLPKFGFKESKMSGSDVDINAEIPDVKVKSPKV
ncbi:AHNAK nucleoprotein-like protein, partial [Euroglyphus maynei]